jgi:uncharacterized membrane protein
MLTSFGTFWGAEGAGAHWPGSDISIVGLIALVFVTSLAMVASLRRRHARQSLDAATREAASGA